MEIKSLKESNPNHSEQFSGNIFLCNYPAVSSSIQSGKFCCSAEFQCFFAYGYFSSICLFVASYCVSFLKLTFQVLAPFTNLKRERLAGMVDNWSPANLVLHYPSFARAKAPTVERRRCYSCLLKRPHFLNIITLIYTGGYHVPCTILNIVWLL